MTIATVLFWPDMKSLFLVLDLYNTHNLLYICGWTEINNCTGGHFQSYYVTGVPVKVLDCHAHTV